MTTRRTVAVTETSATTPSIVVPRGRSAAERRLGALGALHQPVLVTQQPTVFRGDVLDAGREWYVCGECKVPDEMGRVKRAPWPCTSARLMGPWPGGEPE